MAIDIIIELLFKYQFETKISTKKKLFESNTCKYTYLLYLSVVKITFFAIKA